MVQPMLRSPVVAGTFYPLDPSALKAQIEACFKNKLGPGKLPEGKSNTKILGAIVPHAGYPYSGPCAAHTYLKLSEMEKPDTIIILGPSHNALGNRASVWMGSDWEMPFGVVKIDKVLGKEIAESSEMFDREMMCHMNEHSIEVQLPFLQYIYSEIKIVPIVISPEPSQEFCDNVGKAIAQAMKGKKVLILASSDFTHYGVTYGYLPFYGGNIKEKLKAWDYGAIDQIAALNLQGYLEYIKRTDITICGRSAIGVLIAVMNALKAENGNVLNYYHSGEMSGSWGTSVSYASIVFQ